MEIFKDVPGYEKIYQVSNFGRVKSLKFNKERLLKQSVNVYGYMSLSLNKKGKQNTFKVHQLVAMAFLGHKLNGMKYIVDHIDNDKLNNNVDNLQVVSNRINSSKDRKGSSKYTGVCWDKATNKWITKIYINGKNKTLGRFDCEIKASLTYQKELAKL